MRLTVDHVTRYRYDAPVRSVVQSHRLTPSASPGQKVMDWEVTVRAAQGAQAHRDGAGDLVQGWTIAGPVTEIRSGARQVETEDLAGVLRGHRETVAPDCYLRETAPTRIRRGAGRRLPTGANGPTACALPMRCPPPWPMPSPTAPA
jgi:hypothetical protein